MCRPARAGQRWATCSSRPRRCRSCLQAGGWHSKRSQAVEPGRQRNDRTQGIHSATASALTLARPEPHPAGPRKRRGSPLEERAARRGGGIATMGTRAARREALSSVCWSPVHRTAVQPALPRLTHRICSRASAPPVSLKKLVIMAPAGDQRHRTEPATPLGCREAAPSATDTRCSPVAVPDGNARSISMTSFRRRGTIMNTPGGRAAARGREGCWRPLVRRPAPAPAPPTPTPPCWVCITHRISRCKTSRRPSSETLGSPPTADREGPGAGMIERAVAAPMSPQQPAAGRPRQQAQRCPCVAHTSGVLPGVLVPMFAYDWLDMAITKV